MMKFTDKNNILTYAGRQYCPVTMLNEVSDASSVKRKVAAFDRATKEKLHKHSGATEA